MKKLKYLSLVLAGALLFSCSDSFLDENVNQDGPVLPGQVYNTEDGISIGITGVVSMMRTYNVASVNATLYNGIWHVQFAAVMQGNDIFANPSNWWLWEAAWTTGAHAWTAARPLWEWRNLYAMINNCNLLLDALEENKDKFSAEFATNATAELRALRANFYFHLARRYCQPPQQAGGDLTAIKGVPIYTAGTTLETQGAPRGTLQDVYTQILSDLNFAIDNFTYNAASVKYRVGKDIALGWRAYVNLEMGKYQDAYNDAAAIVNSGRYPLMGKEDYAAGFNDVKNSEWMFGLPFNQAQQQSYYSKFAVLDMTAQNTRYRTAGFANTDLMAAFTATDMRNLFIASHNPGVSAYSSAKFYDKEDLTGAYIQMRSSEFVLIMIESLYHLNRNAEAHDLLFALQKHRDPSAVQSLNTAGQALLEEILLEYRKELYGETAPRYYNSRRLGIDMANHGNTPNIFSVPANSSKWTLPIPKSEFDRNPALNLDTDQNAAWQ